MLEAVSLAGGALARLAPEVLNWFDRKDARKHEIAMFDRQLEADRLRGDQAVQQANIQSDAAVSIEELKALVEAVKAQAVPTGIKWVDAINSLMRPLITIQWVIVLYPSMLALQAAVAVKKGKEPFEALLGVWGQSERATCSAIIGYWFMDRTLRAVQGGRAARTHS